MKKGENVIPKKPPRKIGGRLIEDVIEPYRSKRLTPISEKEPEVALQWYFPRNCGFKPDDFFFGSQVNAWWQCTNNSEYIWRARILTRCVQKRNCLYCLGTHLRVPVPYERSFAFKYPELSKEWHKKRTVI